jgi:cyclophilin family peptidyl-prolyl cis-trans isomerase/HEAT repeat protein
MSERGAVSLAICLTITFSASVAAPLWDAPLEAQRAHTETLSASDITRYAQLLQLADQRTFDDTILRSTLTSGSAPIRAASALTLAQLAATHRADVLPLLRQALGETDAEVAANGAFGLGLAKDTSSIDALSAAVARGGEVGRAAAWSLGEIGAPAESALHELLLKHGMAPAVESELLTAEAKMRPPEMSVVLPYLASKNMLVRWAAVYAIARRRNPGGVRALLTLKGDAQVRAEIANGLTHQAAGDSLREEALRVLAQLVLDDYPSVKINAIRAIATYGGIGAVPISRAVSDRDPNVRMAAAQAAGRVLGTDPDQWRDMWGADTTLAYRTAILTSALQAGTVLPEVEKWRSDKRWEYRAASVLVWSDASDTLQGKTVALIAAGDPDGRIRAAAYQVLGSLDPQSRDSVVQRILQTAQSDTDLAAREGNPNYHRVPTAIDSANAHRPISWYETVVREVVQPTLQGHPRGITMVTTQGTISWSMLGVDAPLTVYNFLTLAKRGYFNKLRFHRVVPNFVAQSGDPRGDGNGGPGYAIRDELNRETYVRGTVGMALSGPDTGGSQFFMTLSSQPHLDGHYPVFARVVTGLAAMDGIAQGDVIQSVTAQ